MSLWCIVESAAVTHGPVAWNATALQAELKARGLNVSLPLAELSAAIIDFGTVALYPVTESHPTPFDATYEQDTTPVLSVRTLDVLATYDKEDQTKQAVFDTRIAGLFASRRTRLETGVEDPAELGTYFRLDASEVAKVSLIAANIGTGKYLVDADVETFTVWKTNLDFRSLGSIPQVKNTAKKLGDLIMSLDDVTRIHAGNLVELLADTTTWLGDYTGPGHAAPFTAQDLAEYDITVYWP